MVDSFAFVQHDVHRALLQDILRGAEQDPEVLGVMVFGSVARQEAVPLSDLDVYVLLADGCSRQFRADERGGVLTEITCGDRAHAMQRLETNDMGAYLLLRLFGKSEPLVERRCGAGSMAHPNRFKAREQVAIGRLGPCAVQGSGS